MIHPAIPAGIFGAPFSFSLKEFTTMTTETTTQEVLWLASTKLPQYVYPMENMNERYEVIGCRPTGNSIVQVTGTYRQWRETLYECKCTLLMSPIQYMEESRAVLD